MKRYGYHRTSTKEQHLDRGITEINEYCKSNNLELEKIFTDQQTGKNFNRPRYTIMKEDVLREGDELIITELTVWVPECGICISTVNIILVRNQALWKAMCSVLWCR